MRGVVPRRLVLTQSGLLERRLADYEVGEGQQQQQQQLCRGRDLGGGRVGGWCWPTVRWGSGGWVG